MYVCDFRKRVGHFPDGTGELRFHVSDPRDGVGHFVARSGTGDDVGADRRGNPGQARAKILDFPRRARVLRSNRPVPAQEDLRLVTRFDQRRH